MNKIKGGHFELIQRLLKVICNSIGVFFYVLTQNTKITITCDYFIAIMTPWWICEKNEYDLI